MINKAKTTTTKTKCPNPSWGLSKIEDYIQTRFKKIDALSKSTSVDIYEAGMALSIAKKQLLSRWCQWLDKIGISRNTAWQAVTLYEKCPSSDTIREMTITDAKIKYGICNAPLPSSSSGSHGGGGGSRETQAPEAPRTPGEILDLAFHRLTNSRDAITSIEWEASLLYSTEMNQILLACEQIQSAIKKSRKRIKPIKQSTKTKQVLSDLDNL